MASVDRKQALIKETGRLQFLTMDEGPVDHLRQVEAACRSGIRWVQFRMKDADDGLFQEVAMEVKRICAQWGADLIINDRVEIAGIVGASGVHLGKEDMPVREARRILGDGAIIGGTANTAADILEHCRQGADYIGLGPYRHTTTKKKLSPVLGPDGYLRIMESLRGQASIPPIVAIGGIRMDDVAPLIRLGLHGVAFSGLLVHAEDKAECVRRLESQVSGERDKIHFK